MYAFILPITVCTKQQVTQYNNNKQNTPKINKQHLKSKYNNQQILTNNIYKVTSQHKIQHYTSCQSLIEVVYEVRDLQLTLLALQQACHHNHSGQRKHPMYWLDLIIVRFQCCEILLSLQVIVPFHSQIFVSP